MATLKKELAKVRSKVNLEPAIDQEKYTISMIQATNWYNTNNASADYKTWFMQHFKKQASFSTSEIHDFEFRVGGVLARILANGNQLSDQHLARLESEFARIKQLADVAKPKEQIKQIKRPNVSIQDKIDDKVRDFVGEFNGMVDQFAIDGSLPNVGALLKTMKIAGPIGKKISDRVQRPIQELQEVLEGADKQLAEGYSQFKKTEVKKMLGIYQDLMDKLQQAKVSAPVKSRKPKVVPAGVLVKRVKFKPEFAELKLKSIHPVQIIGASELWVYNTKYKKLQAYYAADGMLLSVKGTTLLNFSTEKSRGKTLRKPEEISVLTGAGKRVYQQFFKAVKSKESAVNGRINEECVLLAAFK